MKYRVDERALRQLEYARLSTKVAETNTVPPGWRTDAVAQLAGQIAGWLRDPVDEP